TGNGSVELSCGTAPTSSSMRRSSGAWVMAALLSQTGRTLPRSMEPGEQIVQLMCGLLCISYRRLRHRSAVVYTVPRAVRAGRPTGCRRRWPGCRPDPADAVPCRSGPGDPGPLRHRHVPCGEGEAAWPVTDPWTGWTP